MTPFYLPSKYTLNVLNTHKWVACYSGGKDSTSLVTWLEWLRRVGWLNIKTPRLVLADTGTEYPFLVTISDKLIAAMEAAGWECEIVRPTRVKKLYVGIFGRGLNPAPPGARGMRWCTAQTKIQPVAQYVKALGPSFLRLSGMRWGESARRDEKLRAGTTGAGGVAASCAAGGECGLPPPGEGSFCPVIAWRTCEVVEWLTGANAAAESVSKFPEDKLPVRIIPDLYPVMKELAAVYEPRYGPKGFGLVPRKIETIRYGCIGCPAVVRDKVIGRKAVHDPALNAVQRVYRVWEELRRYYNRLSRPHPRKPGKLLYGPAKLGVRKKCFELVLEIQKEAGIEIVSAKDEKLIRKLWATGNCYTRNWTPDMDDTWGKC